MIIRTSWAFCLEKLGVRFMQHSLQYIVVDHVYIDERHHANSPHNKTRPTPQETLCGGNTNMKNKLALASYVNVSYVLL